MFELNRTWRVKLYGPTTSTKSLCVTAWGMKDGCNTARYYNRDFTHTFCYRVRVNFKLVEAFCIMTIGFMSLGLIMGILAVFHKVSKGATGAVGTFAMVLCIIPWGIVAGMYHQKPCCETNGWNTDNKVTICTGNNTRLGAEDVPPFKTMGKFGAGFGLIVASWAIQVIALVFAFVPF
ncbi:Amastin surface glycoprotein [Novymonas esmeraldas]|uniref:Amastin surface glycoprotein n=1 Tax=Novymonas esmeraldas TaxID=1808958 RepID=A0AAW0F2L1_9TRYP